MSAYGRLPDPFESLRATTPRTGPVGVPNMGGLATPVQNQPRVTGPAGPRAGRPGPEPHADTYAPSGARADTVRRPQLPAATTGAVPGVGAPPDPTAAAAAAIARFGYFPGADDPNHPPPPVVAGAPAYNPFAPKGREWILPDEWNL